MVGDVAYGDFMTETNYGKGVYIYHNSYCNGSGYLSQDFECADGLWNWIQEGFETPDWDFNHPWLPILKRTTIVRSVHDNGVGENVIANPNTVKDGLTIRGNTTYIPGYGIKNSQKYFSIGKKRTSINGAEDRMLTNEEENWTSREFMVDRWDAWKKGEVFSPYSSPGTELCDNSKSGVFIWIKDYNEANNQATVRVYRDILFNPNLGWIEKDILEATPPSKPMGIKLEYTDCVNEMRYPVIKWSQNTEPDMEFSDNDLLYKKYKIYRAIEPCCKSVPNNYSLLATVNILANENHPSFVDYSFNSVCGPWATVPDFVVRYYITAIDKTNWESVPSDFVATPARTNSDGDFIFNKSNKHDNSFTLFQNYPNPFNPVTNISYDLPQEEFVSLKIYDISGKEVASLVNEYKKAGKFIVSFNGSNLSSGIYFYRIQAGKYVSVKKMVLIK